MSFSPSGRFAYLSSRYELFQLDTWEEDFDNSFILIDTISVITNVGIRLDFSNSMLAPDCKIYISTSFTWETYHVIHRPDEKGKACNLRKLDLRLPWPNRNSAVPNNVHYRMDEEEVCNPRLTSLFPEEWYGRDKITIYPNPTSDLLMVLGEKDYQMDILTISGESKISLSSTIGQTIDVSKLPPNMYVVKLTDKRMQKTTALKVIKL